jgi:hypothetical protein
MPSDWFTGAALVSTLTDEQAKAVQSVSEFGTTVVNEGSNLARYMGRILGTVPEDAVGVVIGDPLRFVRTAIAAQYDILLDRILKRRDAKTQPVSPSVAIPLMRAAYDEGRPELQELWASLIASAMDPARATRVRVSFIETLKQFDPLDAIVLKTRSEIRVSTNDNAISKIAVLLHYDATEIQLSVENLDRLKCIFYRSILHEFTLSNYGSALLKACTD